MALPGGNHDLLQNRACEATGSRKTLKDFYSLGVFFYKKIFMKALEFSAGTAQITEQFLLKGVDCECLDNHQLRNSRRIDYLMDFLEFDYKSIHPDTYNFLFFGVPCTAFSKASGGKHFTKDFARLTARSEEAVLIVNRVFEIIRHFKNAVWYIENPAGGLYRYLAHIGIIGSIHMHVYRIDQLVFGFPTKKQTDIFTNSSVPILVSPVFRVNGKYQKQKFDNLTLKQRQAYTSSFCAMIVDNALLNF